MIRVCGCLELLDLLTTQTQFLANALNPVNADLDVVISKILLQALRTVGFLGSFMSRCDFEFEPFFFFLPGRFRSL
jgi:hypothetical protein